MSRWTGLSEPHGDDGLMRPFTIVGPDAPDVEPGGDGGQGGGHGP
ncbi:hypothetical protein [Streptomyces sp. 147326]